MSDRANADRIVRMIERGREDAVRRAATALYVESRIALVAYPDIRLRTTVMYHRRAVLLHLHGWHHASRWTTWGIDGAIEFWAEEIEDDAEQCAAVARWRVEREFSDLMRRDGQHDDLKGTVRRYD